MAIAPGEHTFEQYVEARRRFREEVLPLLENEPGLGGEELREVPQAPRTGRVGWVCEVRTYG
jgi:hypothetical protein